MHTTEINKTVFIHNSDLSGNVEIVCKGKRIEIPGDDLIEFVGRHIIDQQISKLENMSGTEFLLGKDKV